MRTPTPRRLVSTLGGLCAAALALLLAPAARAQTIIDSEDLFHTLGTQTTTKTGEQTYMVDAADFGAVPDDDIDDSVAIQAALDHVAPIAAITKPGTYTVGANRQLISLPGGFHVATLTIGSFKTLRLAPGVIIKLADNSNCLMLANKSGQAGDHNVTIEGGTWDANGTRNDMRTPTLPVVTFGGTGGYRPYWCGQAMQLVMCRNLTLRNLSIINGKKYAIHAAGGSNINIHDIDFDTMSDGVHLNGPVSGVRINSIRGFAHDNLVAIIASEGTYYPELTGDAVDSPRDITNLEISDISCGLPGRPTFQPIRFTGRPTDTISNVTISRVVGDNSIAGHGIAFGDDNHDTEPGPGYTSAGLEHCNIFNVLIEDIALIPQPGYSVIQIGGSGVRDVTIRRAQQVSITDSLVLVDKNADLDSLVIEDIHAPANNARLISIEARVRNLTVRNAWVESARYSRPIQIASGSRCDNLLVEDSTFVGGAHHILKWWTPDPTTLTLRRCNLITGETSIGSMSTLNIITDRNTWNAAIAISAPGGGTISLDGSGDICVRPITLGDLSKGIRINNPDMQTDAYLLSPRVGDRVHNINARRHEIPAGLGVLTCSKAGFGPGTAQWVVGDASARAVRATPTRKSIRVVQPAAVAD